MTIHIVGDWCPELKFIKVPLRSGSILANLEGPILPDNQKFFPVPKAGPNLFSRELPDQNNQYIFSLANNHLMDYGILGYESTINFLNQRKMKFCGAGKTIQEARSPLIIEDNGVSIGIISCCEAQFGVATRNTTGVAEFGPWIYQTIHDLSKKVDAIIISVHAGVEDSPWPSPFIRELYHSFIEAGAKVIHGHHAHIPQGYEKYHNGIIFYGMGNFAVDPDRWTNYPNAMWSLGADIDFSSAVIQWQPITYESRYRVGSNRIYIEESSKAEFENHQQYFEKCNRPFNDETLFEALWQEVSLRAYYAYGGKCMNFLRPSDFGCLELIKKVLSKIRPALFMKSSRYSPDIHRLLLYYHMIACESHRQMLKTALGILSGEIKDLRNDETCLLADEMVPLRICGSW